LNPDVSDAPAAMTPREQAGIGFSKRAGCSLRRHGGASVYFIAQSLA
jgi:hypothetical protein